MNYLRFFAGTPQRFLATLGAVAAAATVSKVWPGLINSALAQLGRELAPLFQPVATLLIVFVGFRVLFSAFGGSKKK